MAKSKEVARTAAALRLEKTIASVEERVRENDQRELALLRDRIVFDPLEILNARFETFAEVMLGERRYIEYVAAFQDKREELLDKAEAVVNRQKLTAGLQLPGADTSHLVGARDT